MSVSREKLIYYNTIWIVLKFVKLRAFRLSCRAHPSQSCSRMSNFPVFVPP
jgi:hypothetical protein